MFWNTLMLSIRALRRNIMRSSLTILGIVIGVAAVIVIVTLGNGARQQVTGQIGQLGDNLLVLSPAGPPFEQADIQAIRREIAGIQDIAPMAQLPVLAIYGGEDHQSTVVGVDAAYFDVIHLDVDLGQPLTDAQLRGSRMICLVGPTIQKELFDGGYPLGASLRLGKVSCPIIGVMKSRGGSVLGGDQDNYILAPIGAVQSRITGARRYNQVLITTTPNANIDFVVSDIEDLMRVRRHIGAQSRNNFQVTKMSQVAGVLDTVTGALTGFLGAIAAVSLLVGGIGIMNIMLVSVTERTREIGIRLAIGAQEGEIQMQFLMEAIILTALGGLVGVGLGLGSSYLVGKALNFPFVFDIGIVLKSVLFSALIGVVFGFFPARRAARLDPIQALRYE